jgi:2-dehydro-3-deoxyphosphogluconate aldolase / (4S)-4-hydroxy-2-oxoglutarate aldolase
MNADAVLQQLGDRKIVAVVRAPSAEQAVETARALDRGGVTAIEIAFTTPGAATAISAARELDGVVVGAGTVRTRAELEAAIEAGAAFVASPGTNLDLVVTARSAGVLAIPGVFTPTEIEQAAPHALLLKLFPAGAGGPSLLRTMRGPYPDLRFMPTGGVRVDNVCEWLAAGAFAVGAGSDLCPAGAIERGDYGEIASRAARYAAAVSA